MPATENRVIARVRAKVQYRGLADIGQMWILVILVLLPSEHQKPEPMTMWEALATGLETKAFLLVTPIFTVN